MSEPSSAPEPSPLAAANVIRGDAAYAAAARARRWRRIRSSSLAMFVGLAAIAFGVPPLLGKVGMDRVEGIRSTLGECRDAIDEAGSTDVLFRLEGLNPVYASRARAHRDELLTSVMSGLGNCGDNVRVGCPPALAARGSAFVVERMPELRSAQDEFGRAWFETFLVEQGRNDDVFELARRLPPGGVVDGRVLAHLDRGDLRGAAAALREPGANHAVVHPRTAGTLLCMEGDYAEGLAVLASSGKDLERGDVFTVYAECSLQAGAVAGLKQHLQGDPDPYWNARIAAHDGHYDAALEALGVVPNRDRYWDLRHVDDLKSAVFALWLLGKVGSLDQYARDHGARWWMPHEIRSALDAISGRRMWGEPDPVDERMLAELIDMVIASKHSFVRSAAGGLQLIRASYLVDRGDSTAKHALRKARHLLGVEADRAEILEATHALFEDGWTDGPEVHERLRAAVAISDHAERVRIVTNAEADADELERELTHHDRIAADRLEYLVTARKQGESDSDNVYHSSRFTPYRSPGEPASHELLYFASLMNDLRGDVAFRIIAQQMKRRYRPPFRELKLIIAAGNHLNIDISKYQRQLSQLQALVERPGNTIILGSDAVSFLF
ncbi:MAG: hypothetical protein AB7O24_02600 [Kofleriaceae bacterium]